MSESGTPLRLTSELAAEIRARREAISRARRRIAIVGMGCRFPGGASPSAFWGQLEAARDGVAKGRPSGVVGGAGVEEAEPWGAYLADVDRFDAGFFRIAPVEAEVMDPQHRLLLETSWEALEDAGMDPRGLRGSSAGVYVGIGNADYVNLTHHLEPTLHTATGTAFSAAIGRVAFTLGLEGPAIAVDTACSSSLVAIHQALAGLQRGEADLALAGG